MCPDTGTAGPRAQRAPDPGTHERSEYRTPGPQDCIEGTGRGRGRARQNHYRIARGSLCECAAVLDLLGESERKAQASKVDAMLRGLLRC